jgi:hypothetical protein
MRSILPALVAGLGLAACAAKVPVIESGRFACQPPQLAGLSNKVVGGLCVQDDIVADLNATGPRLEVAARADYFQHENELTAEPKAISCRLDDGLTYCAFNSYWASATWILPHRPPSIHTMFPPESTAPYAPFASTGGSAQFAPQ